MLLFVTIVARRRAYWSLFVVACLCAAVYVPLFSQFVASPAAPSFLVKAHAATSMNLGGLRLSSHVAAALGIGLCVVYATFTLGFILFNFRKTASAEIFFYAFWVLSVGLEVLRLALAWAIGGGAPIPLQILGAKALVFSRFVGYFSIFLSGLYAVGFRNEKLGTVIALMVAVAFGLAASIPVDTGSFTVMLELRPGYANVTQGLGLVAGLVTIANFLHAARVASEAAYRAAALGCLLFLLGRHLLVAYWNPYLMGVGLILLATGSALFVRRLHAYYLWQ